MATNRDAEAVAMKFDRFHLDLGFPTAGNSTPGGNFEFSRGEFHSYDFVLNVAVFQVLVSASSFPDYSLFDCVTFPDAFAIAATLRLELRTLFRTAILLL